MRAKGTEPGQTARTYRLARLYNSGKGKSLLVHAGYGLTVYILIR